MPNFPECYICKQPIESFIVMGDPKGPTHDACALNKRIKKGEKKRNEKLPVDKDLSSLES